MANIIKEEKGVAKVLEKKDDLGRVFFSFFFFLRIKIYLFNIKGSSTKSPYKPRH